MSTLHPQKKMTRPSNAKVISNKERQPKPIPNEAHGKSAAEALLVIEETARNAQSTDELFALLANQSRRLTGARQVFVFELTEKFQLKSVSGLTTIDPSAPTVKGMHEVLANLVSKRAFGKAGNFHLDRMTLANGDLLSQYPFKELLWVPLKSKDLDILGGIILSREKGFSDSDRFIAERIMATFSHALEFLLLKPAAPTKTKRTRRSTYKMIAVGSVLAALLLFIPVPMMTLATVEVTPANPFILASPLNAAIEEVLVEPNEPVRKGQPLVRFEQTSLLNTLEIAKRQIAIAEARIKKANQLAFNDPEGLHDLSIATAERDLQIAAFESAQANFNRSTLYATEDGVAIFPDKQALIGRPVNVGERIMQIANPEQVELTMKLEIADAIPVDAGGAVRVYLDSDPFSSHQAVIKFANYEVQTDASNQAYFPIFATFTGPATPKVRLGTRGTAQIFGERVSLGFYLFRKPLSALRQWIGF